MKKIILFENMMETSKVNEINHVNCEALVFTPKPQWKYKKSTTSKDIKKNKLTYHVQIICSINPFLLPIFIALRCYKEFSAKLHVISYLQFPSKLGFVGTFSFEVYFLLILVLVCFCTFYLSIWSSHLLKAVELKIWISITVWGFMLRSWLLKVETNGVDISYIFLKHETKIC